MKCELDMRDLLELELSDELAPAAAPNELWDRVGLIGADSQVCGRPPGPSARRTWVAAAALMLLTVVGGFWFGLNHPALDFERLAAEQRQATLDLRSSDPREIAAWVRRETGAEFSCTPSSAVRLTGA